MIGDNPTATAPRSASASARVFERSFALSRGEQVAMLCMAAQPQPIGSLDTAAAWVEVQTGRTGAFLVPTQVLRRADFPGDGSEKSFRLYFYVEEKVEQVIIRVTRAGTAPVRVSDCHVVPPATPPTRLLLVAGRGADVSGWNPIVRQGSQSYGLVDGGQNFLVFVVHTSPCGSLAERTLILAETINRLHLPARSLKAIGHSMGGLDLRYLVGLGHDNIEPYASAARKLRKVYTLGTPHHGAWLANLGQIPIFSRLFAGFLCIGKPLLRDVTPASMSAFNRRYPRSEFTLDGVPVPFLAFTFQARCLSRWLDPSGWIGRHGDTIVSVSSQAWDPSDNPPGDLPWSAVHAPPLDQGRCIAERAHTDVLRWVLADNIS